MIEMNTSHQDDDPLIVMADIVNSINRFPHVLVLNVYYRSVTFPDPAHSLPTDPRLITSHKLLNGLRIFSFV